MSSYVPAALLGVLVLLALTARTAGKEPTEAAGEPPAANQRSLPPSPSKIGRLRRDSDGTIIHIGPTEPTPPAGPAPLTLPPDGAMPVAPANPPAAAPNFQSGAGGDHPDADALQFQPFDLTPFLKTGENLLALKVIRYSDSSYVEDQDQWWLGGLHRSVFLYSTEAAYLADVDARPTLSADSSSGSVDLCVKLGFTADPARDAQVEGSAAADYAATGGSATAWSGTASGSGCSRAFRGEPTASLPPSSSGAGRTPGAA